LQAHICVEKRSGRGIAICSGESVVDE